MKLPKSGRDATEILDTLNALKTKDVDWKGGKCFAYVYDAGPEAMDLLKNSFNLFMTENGLDPSSFPSCLELERDVIAAALDLQEAPETAAGSFTSGGTESILLSVKTARDYYRSIRPEITSPEIILPETAHPAFYKAFKYFDIKPVQTKVDPTSYEAIPSEIEKAITENTIMIVASAPSYGMGIMDPIPAIAAIAKKHHLLCHVDSCVGGMYMPFAKKHGYEMYDFNLSVDGVTQLSMDFHKWGYAAKGASAILYKDSALRRHQIFAWSGWMGYTVVNPTVMSTKSGGPVAACWAILNHIGEEGYMDLVGKTQAASEKIRAAIKDIEGLRLLGNPKGNLFAFTAEDFDIFALSEAMKTYGWYIQPQFGFNTVPANIHLSVGASNAPHVDDLIHDLRKCVTDLRSNGTPPLMNELPAQLLEMFENAGPELFDLLGSTLGTDGSDLPDNMREINNLMNLMPSQYRDQLLVEYMNRLYVR
ncbi:aspartate aminotransferase family protein [Temperatibacter marinus]|uniref:Aspartate aminotransferase family protein n=1 Tax=Temperatibacter marinus TaxID=1456591 RepID=A0AA52EFV6_9PROT|nr:aspartate aminotransferase family protein [Temperatibacter marinus]WND02923.1 aspartate aminotransferase family protein [Temperatibacter marinus]